MDFQFGHIDFMEMHRCSYKFFTLDHKFVLSRLHCMDQQYIVWVKIIVFSFMTKIIRILIRDHVP